MQPIKKSCSCAETCLKSLCSPLSSHWHHCPVASQIFRGTTSVCGLTFLLFLLSFFPIQFPFGRNSVQRAPFLCIQVSACSALFWLWWRHLWVHSCQAAALRVRVEVEHLLSLCKVTWVHSQNYKNKIKTPKQLLPHCYFKLSHIWCLNLACTWIYISTLGRKWTT